MFRNGALETGEVTPRPGNVTLLHEDLYDGSLPTLTAEQAGAGGMTLFDVDIDHAVQAAHIDFGVESRGVAHIQPPSGWTISA